MKDSHPQAKAHESVQFKFNSKDEYQELIFDAKQAKSMSGWIIKPHDLSMKVLFL